MSIQVTPDDDELRAAAPTELSETGLNHRDALLSVTDDAILWRTPDGETFATVTVGEYVEHHPLNSRAFRDYMLAKFAHAYLCKGRPASVGDSAVRDALHALEARAYTAGITLAAPLRVAQVDDGVCIDRGSDDWSVIHVTAVGWSIVKLSPSPIVRSRRTAVMPVPAKVGGFRPLRELLGMPENDFILFVSWCLAALWAPGPYPILILGGEQGSGKSTLARLVQRLVDPVAGDLLQPPGNDRDLIAAAKHGRVLAFDNISKISSELADAICRLATGAEIGGRAMYTNHNSATFAACRPIILNGIPHLATRGDMADRAIFIKLAPRENRITEKDWNRRVAALLPTTFAALLDALVEAVAAFDNVPTPNVRMADFATLIIAAEAALPWREGQFIEAYRQNHAETVAALIEGDLVATKVREFARSHPEGWSGLMSVLYERISLEVPLEVRRTKDWPGNARWFSDRLTRAAPALREAGFDLCSKQEAPGTKVYVTPVAPVAPLAPFPAAPARCADGANGASGASGANDALPQRVRLVGPDAGPAMLSPGSLKRWWPPPPPP